MEPVSAPLVAVAAFLAGVIFGAIIGYRIWYTPTGDSENTGGTAIEEDTGGTALETAQVTTSVEDRFNEVLATGARFGFVEFDWKNYEAVTFVEEVTRLANEHSDRIENLQFVHILGDLDPKTDAQDGILLTMKTASET